MPVRGSAANGWALHEMHGNVWEWCKDWVVEEYPAGDAEDPQGPLDGKMRIMRGGSWITKATSCRSAYRNGGLPDAANSSIGFRVVLELPR